MYQDFDKRAGVIFIVNDVEDLGVVPFALIFIDIYIHKRF